MQRRAKVKRSQPRPDWRTLEWITRQSVDGQEVVVTHMPTGMKGSAATAAPRTDYGDLSHGRGWRALRRQAYAELCARLLEWRMRNDAATIAADDVPLPPEPAPEPAPAAVVSILGIPRRG